MKSGSLDETQSHVFFVGSPFDVFDVKFCGNKRNVLWKEHVLKISGKNIRKKYEDQKM